LQVYCFQQFADFLDCKIFFLKELEVKIFFLKELMAFMEKTPIARGLVIIFYIDYSGWDGTTMPRDSACLERGFAVWGLDRVGMGVAWRGCFAGR
jgi:hypothetical protein